MTSWEKENLTFYVIATTITTIILAITLTTCNPAFGDEEIPTFLPDTDYKVELLADAIFWAEGGYNTNYLFGIKSIDCEGYDECRRICKNTIKANIRRYKIATKGGKIKYRQNGERGYLGFLQSRYCPTTGNLSASEKELNGHWLKNVKWFLENPMEVK